ncbi:peroxidase 60-like [Primulina eburnea]|uniref:peroxidase 60-like n=1 Tax=Primulina eburnea TaxID=1245227 RepID=UPI003C6C78D5
MAKLIIMALAFLVCAASRGRCEEGGTPPLQVGFYDGKCADVDVEAAVGAVVASFYDSDPTVAAALLRLQFHDCFIHGCDASILLDGPESEKTSSSNRMIRGYDLIEAAKSSVEAVCPGVVSCADIIVMATRDAVSLGGGGRYTVQTGRRDGTVSFATDVNMPASSISVSDSIKVFGEKGLSPTDMVYLLGGHTIGVARCSTFQDRLYNFQNTGEPDPTMDSTLRDTLLARCPQDSDSDENTVDLDQNASSSSTVDNSYYQQILSNRGILQIDQELALDQWTRPTVDAIAQGLDFTTGFGQAMIKLGAVQVLTGEQGEIRRFCNRNN